MPTSEYAYHAFPFTVDTTGEYDLVTIATSRYGFPFDALLYLYHDVQPGSPGGYAPNCSGTFTNELSGPGQIAPEPTTILLTLAGLAGLVIFRKR
jgi:hypothetical protein